MSAGVGAGVGVVVVVGGGEGVGGGVGVGAGFRMATAGGGACAVTGAREAFRPTIVCDDAGVVRRATAWRCGGEILGA